MAGRRLGRGLQFLLSDRAEKAAEKAAATAPERSPDTSSESGTQTETASEGSKAEAGKNAKAVSKDPPATDSPAKDSPAKAGSPSEKVIDPPQTKAVPPGTSEDPTNEVDIALLSPNPHQPRKVFREDELQALADSVRSSGILQAILVRPKPGGRFEIVAGERRFRAAKRAGLARVPVLVRDVDDVDLRLFALVENLQRSDLDPIEKARSFRDIKDATGWTHGKIAEAVGFERSHVSNFLRLLELEAPIQKDLREGRMSMGHARALLAAKPERRAELAQRIRDEGLSVREVERLAKSKPAESQPAASQDAEGPTPKPRAPAWAREMQENLIEALGCKVAVHARGKRGRIVLDVGTRSEFDRVYELLMSTMPGADEEQLVRKRKKAK